MSCQNRLIMGKRYKEYGHKLRYVLCLYCIKVGREDDI